MANATSTLEIPSELAPDVEALVSYLREVRRRAPTERDLLQEERTLQLRLNAVGRAAMRAVLASADTHAAEIEIDGATWGNRRLTTGEYETLFGTVSLERSIYQQRGRGRAAVALDLRLGIFEGRYTPATARVLCHAVGLMPEHDAEKFLAEVGVATLSVSTLHRIPRAIAARHETQREIIDRAVREVDRIPEEAVAVQALVDGVMVPQDGEHTRARGRKPKGEAEPPRHEKRYGPVGADSPAANDGEGGRPWHEASVGALHFMNELGAPLHTICLARMPEPRKATLFGQLETELTTVLSERPELDVVLASDGALVHWEELERIAERIRPLMTGRIFFALDFYHAAEYLTKAAEIVWSAGDAQAAVHAATWRETLQRHTDGADRVLGSLRYFRDRLDTAASRRQLQGVIDFLANQHAHGRMNYAALDEEGLPIGTGVIEAAAKTLVNVRMKRAGSRFSQHGGQAVLLFRAATASDRFEPLMRELHLTYRSKVVEPTKRAA